MKMYTKIVCIIALFGWMQYVFAENIIEENGNESSSSQLNKDDEKLLEEIVEIISSSYKGVVDIAALYFCGFSIDQNKLYDQIFMLISRDMLNVVKLFAWYIPVMLKNPKTTIKEKCKKSFYIIATTAAFWYIFTQILFKNSQDGIEQKTTRSLPFSLSQQSYDNARQLEPRPRLKI